MDGLALLAGGAVALVVAAAAIIARLAHARRALARKVVLLEESVEHLTDRVFELAESEERHRGLIDTQGDIIVRRDREGRITYANRAFAELVGLGADQLVGSGSGVDVRARSDERREADGSVSVDEFVATAHGGRWIAWRHHPVRDGEGRCEETQSVGRDITERKVAEVELARSRARAQGANEAKSRFLATMSHEIRTPLNGIMGMADLLLDTPLTPEQKSYAGAVKASGEALLTLIDDILDFSKIEAGRLDLEPAPFDLLPLVEGVAELLGPRAQAKGLDLVAAVDPALPGRLVGDATRLRQVLLNLVGNAVKFTEKGGITVTVRGEDGVLAIDVADTGPGIAPDDVKRIFGEFEQGETTLARRHAGTGLGLAISRRIIALMEGELSVTTELGQGSRFGLRVPLAPAETMPRALPSLHGLSVLVLSPSVVEAPVLAERLRARGALALAVSDEAAIPAEGRFDTVILDNRLGEDAIAACLAGLGERAGRTVLLVTPAARSQVAIWRRRGVTGWLVSPVREASLCMQVAPGGMVDAPPLAPDAEPDRPAAAMPARPLTILVAEDNEINALLARKLVESMGHRPLWARDGRAAVDMALDPEQGVDLVLMDMQMPDCDGLSAAKMIRAREAAGRRMPIVALTANAFVEDRAAAIAAGMDAFVTKPLDRDRLAETIAEHAVPTSSDPGREDRRKAKRRR
ncbi:ATP-binding protein [Phreatobacter sp.]|uniref:PAS domain-containing hybrid sensor histidine kinase/response regulator n=1 Tax=Phreatobacter sp. TaxID=1966341 RepID=UPI003F70FD25